MSAELVRQVLGGDPPSLADRLLLDLRSVLGRVPTGRELFDLSQALTHIAGIVAGSPPAPVKIERPCEACRQGWACIAHDVLITDGRDG